MIDRRVVWAVAAAVAAALVVFAWHAYPTPSTDAPGFLVSAINHATGRGLVNPYYPQMRFADPTGANRHVYYPPLFPLTVAALLPEPTPRGAFLAVAALRAASLALAAAALCALAARVPARREGGLTLPAALALFGMGTNWLPTIGRAEALGTLFVLLGALAALELRGPALIAAAGVILGAAAATQPLGALELALAAVLFFAATRPTAGALRASAATAVIAALVVAAVLAASPHGLGETVLGMARAYPHTPWSSPPGTGWWRPWILARRSTFYGALFVAALACGAHLLWPRRRRIGAPWLFAAAAALLAAAVYHGSISHKGLRNYNALMLGPLAFGLVLAWAAVVGDTAPRLARAAVLACVAATTIGFFGHLAFFPWFLRHARSLPSARAEWASVPLPPGPVSMIGNLWVLTDDHGRLEVTPVTRLAEPWRMRPVLVIGQRPEHGGRAPHVPGYALAKDLFNPALAGGGLRRHFVAEDYSFAVYVRSAEAR